MSCITISAGNSTTQRQFPISKPNNQRVESRCAYCRSIGKEWIIDHGQIGNGTESPSDGRAGKYHVKQLVRDELSDQGRCKARTAMAGCGCRAAERDRCADPAPKDRREEKRKFSATGIDPGWPK